MSGLFRNTDVRFSHDTAHLLYRVFRSPTQMEVTRRTTYDGREISFVTLNTQTDWDWVSEVESGTARTVELDSKLICMSIKKYADFFL